MFVPPARVRMGRVRRAARHQDPLAGLLPLVPPYQLVSAAYSLQPSGDMSLMVASNGLLGSAPSAPPPSAVSLPPVGLPRLDAKRRDSGDSEARSTHSSSNSTADDHAPNKIFVGGISFQTTPEKLRAYFAPYGTILDVMVLKDPATNYVLWACVEPTRVSLMVQHSADRRGSPQGPPEAAPPTNDAQWAHNYIDGVNSLDDADLGQAAVSDDAMKLPKTTRDSQQFELIETATFSNIWYAGHANTSEFGADELATLREVFDFIETPTAACKNLSRLGGLRYTDGSDGDKMACFDRPLTLGQPGCLVYSFGINDEWSFDRAAAALGCEVHSFDPSMQSQKEGQVGPGITFHRVGVGRNNHTNERGWPILVLDHMMATLGHRRRTIQYLKADAEGGEMDMLIDQLVDLKSMYRVFVLDRVEQLGLELHMRLLPEREAAFYRDVRAVFRQLRLLGFDLVFSQPNQLVWERYMFPGVPRPVSLLYEVLLVRRRRAAPHFDANVHYPCGSKERCDAIDGVSSRRKARAAAPPSVRKLQVAQPSDRSPRT